MRGILLGLILLSFMGCATMIHRREAQIVSASGSITPIKVIDDQGNVVYAGPLPAKVKVKTGWNKSYKVIYTENGQERVVSIGDKFNGFLVASIFLGFLPVVIDLATGNVMEVEALTTLP